MHKYNNNNNDYVTCNFANITQSSNLFLNG